MTGVRTTPTALRAASSSSTRAPATQRSRPRGRGRPPPRGAAAGVLEPGAAASTATVASDRTVRDVRATRCHGRGEGAEHVAPTPVVLEGDLQPARAVELREQEHRGLVAAGAAGDGPAVPVGEACIDGLRGLEAGLLVGRAGDLEEQRLPEGRADVAGRPEGGRGCGAPELGARAIEEDDPQPVEPRLEVAVRSRPEADPRDPRWRREAALPPRIVLGGGVGHAPGLVGPVRLTVDGAPGVTAVGRRGLGRADLRVEHGAPCADELDLGEREDPLLPRELHANTLDERRAVAWSRQSADAERRQHEVPAAAPRPSTREALRREGVDAQRPGRVIDRVHRQATGRLVAARLDPPRVALQGRHSLSLVGDDRLRSRSCRRRRRSLRARASSASA